jgi:hypothetical protein
MRGKPRTEECTIVRTGGVVWGERLCDGDEEPRIKTVEWKEEVVVGV